MSTVVHGAEHARQLRDRDAMRRLVTERSFDHALQSLADVVAVAVTPPYETEENNRRMARAAKLAEAKILDGMVELARMLGWKGAG